MKIGNVMSKDIIICDRNDTIYDVASKMKKYDVGMVLIKDMNKIIGIVTDRDIVINHIYNKVELIYDMMAKSIITISKNESLEMAAEIMKKKRIKRLIVIDDNKIIGVISLSDIVGKINNDLFINTFKSIYEINRNDNKFNTEIDEFYL